jgi:ABC-type sugar transport system permease subunit/ABC-type glycerol-3-phosphate transport system substrate-binding protein
MDIIKLRVFLLIVMVLPAVVPAGDFTSDKETVEFKAWGVPDGNAWGPAGETAISIVKAFQKLHPDVKLVPATGLSAGGRSMDTIPLMQIAGDISPVVIYVNFRQSSTYINQKFLYPLDKYLEKTSATDVRDGHLMSTAQYLSALRKGSRYKENDFEERLSRQCWEVIRRECPYGEKCPYVKEWNATVAEKHQHVWCLPQSQGVIALFYRKDLFAEAGLPDRAPADMAEFLEWARKIHNPKEDVYGFNMALSETAWCTLSFFYSCGARAVERDAQGNWRCVFNSPEAVNAYYYVARLFLEPFENKFGKFEGVVNLGEQNANIRYAMYFSYIDQKTFDQIDPNIVNFGPVPKGPNGVRGSEFNAQMTGIYAGFDKDTRMRDIAWDWMLFYGGNEAKLIQAKVYVENGLGRFVQPKLLEQAGYPEFIKKVPAGWAEASVESVKSGVPEPYGRNCQMVYNYMNHAIDQIRTDSEVKRCIDAKDEVGAKKRIQEILNVRVDLANQKMLNLLPADVRKFQTRVAGVVSLFIFTVFILVLLKVFKTFSKSVIRSDEDRARGEWQFGRNKVAYLILLPAVLSIAVWSYWPLMRGTVMAFQDYNVRGFSTWTGFDNFATVLFSNEFWYALYVSLKYTILFMTFGFIAPIILALMLAEVPKGKILFRVIYYLPAMLSGVVVIFLWKGFYGQHGMINQVLNFGVIAVNWIFGANITEFSIVWLNSPSFALVFCLLPTVWAGMGPGCLIYLAALKGIPDDLYEAADIDGAGSTQKAWYIAIPSIKALISINFIGAAIGCMQSGSSFVLAMTGGGPYAPYGETEVIGLHIFWEAFGFLRFGVATAMAWVLGVILIGFTVQQLQKLSKMEFKAAGGK